ncbi:MAG: hypothetical protein Ta2B_23920 [Termitinemataceae bacterium]|nr:MAG: hypothetical protein Ta2B_23920 [Termitinemataceae bacterium]
MTEEKLNWHSAFYDAIRLELEPYLDVLEFSFEHELNTDPLRIDAIIIKKEKAVTIKKNIAEIFDVYNIVEFKSPEDYLAVNDFHKAMSYTHLYCATSKNVGIADVTLTFVVTRHPREVLKHLEEDCRYKVRQKYTGIYVVENSLFPIQIIETKLLSEEDNLWLKDISNNLGRLELKKIMNESSTMSKSDHIRAYLDVLLKANTKIAEEMRMNESKAFYEMLERTGVIADFEARGEARGKNEVLDLWRSGKTYEEAVKIIASEQKTVNTMNKCN